MAIVSSLHKQNKQKIYEGGCKDVFQLGDEESTLVLFFKDDIRRGDEVTTISGKGVINNSISSFMMEKIDMVGIDHHFLERANMREQLVQILDIVPVQVRVSNVATDHYVSHFGVQSGYVFDAPMIDFRVKNKSSLYPSINENQICGFNWAIDQEVKEMKKMAIRVNDFLSGYFAGIGLRLIECNLEFGRVFNGEDFIFMLGDEITPESCKLWDLDSNQKFDLETILKHKNPIEIYKEIAKRMRLKV
ncbi:MAG: phosphoribosylaminoimidazolesuccinocarboxamide synthase [Rickettsiaceae bacterium]|nr:phosphoribosylaminoimidazolesuccinocarboxamide synthase [Rickettsiaceae bacterium]